MTGNRLLRRAAGPFAGAAIGALGFLAMLGGSILELRNIGWLQGGDPGMYFLSAGFYQDAPWSIPPGLSTTYGVDVPNSIANTDAIPIFAMAFKAMRGLTGHPIQYWGWWVFTCFALQGLFGWVLAGRVTRSPILKACFACLLVFSPIFFARCMQLMHLPILAHFLILAALAIALAPASRARHAQWIVLMGVGVLCTPYIFSMAAAIWVADLVVRALRAEQPGTALLGEMIAVPVVCVFGLWFEGFFALSSGYEAAGFGVYRANLLAMFDAKPDHLTYSHFWPHTPQAKSGGNAPNFFGTGLILLIAAGVLSATLNGLRGAWHRRYWGVTIAVMLMLVYALSNNVAIGSFEFQYPLPEWFIHLAGMLRTSERFMWPLLYLMGLAALGLVARWRKPVAIATAVAAAALQVFDTTPAWKGGPQAMRSRRSLTWTTPLRSQFWDVAGRTYRSVKWMPNGRQMDGYDTIAYFALTHHMSTNSAYLSRFDHASGDRANAAFEHDLDTGNLPADTMYILDEPYWQRAQAHAGPNDLLLRVDGLVVLAPQWRTRSHDNWWWSEKDVANDLPKTPSGVQMTEVSASSTTPRYGPKLMTDNKPGGEHAWHSTTRPTFPQWVALQYEWPILISQFDVQSQESPADGLSNLPRAPKDVELWAGDAPDATLTKIATWTCQFTKAGDWCRTPVAPTRPYSYFRLVINSNYGNIDYVTIQELDLVEQRGR